MNIDQVFDGMGLSEEATDKIKTIFQAAVNESVKASETQLRESITAELESLTESYGAYLKNEFETKSKNLAEEYEANGRELVEQYEAKVKTLEIQADAYMTESVKQWISENKVELSNKLKLEKMEKFVTGMRDLFVESAILLPDADFTLGEQLQKEIDTLKESNACLVARIESLNEESLKAKKAQVFTELSEGLTDLQVEKLRSLSVGVEAKTVEEFAMRLNTLKEAFLTPEPTTVTESVKSEQKATKPAIAAGVKPSLFEAIEKARTQK